ncbi:hypothetical protein EOL73_00345 [Candidatus Saccharibacteria bacterium]|nr:hypothetical protein [Candidatus Saccharibacteria bacterium]NCU40191.1 hypothetical protein [Candidatus Saccharibacteria bacterium]
MVNEERSALRQVNRAARKLKKRIDKLENSERWKKMEVWERYLEHDHLIWSAVWHIPLRMHKSIASLTSWLESRALLTDYYKDNRSKPTRRDVRELCVYALLVKSVYATEEVR